VNAAHALADPQEFRRAGRELLSLALLDARNQLLQRLQSDESTPALRLALHAAWYQEHWIACHVQRGRGPDCDPAGPRMAGLEPAVEDWLAPAGTPPAPEAVRAYLAQTLEVTLELLAGSAEDDAALHFYRLSLLHEDRLCEAMDVRLRAGAPPARARRDALWLPSQRWTLGSAEEPARLMPLEGGRQELNLPEFEIDAQAVSWAQFVEFAEDEGYDRPELWTDAGWAWVQAQQRRAPLHVEQLRGAVIVQRGSTAAPVLQRAAPGQAALHLSRHEAQAWCSWAGRRLPTEPEWELAATTCASRGFVWGDVFEWVAGSARTWPGWADGGPGALDRPPRAGDGVLRGGSFATRARWLHAKARRFAAPERDHLFCGFRSCAL
jgi:formylglycine-generating enzyme required for sulfatase activity